MSSSTSMADEKCRVVADDRVEAVTRVVFPVDQQAEP
jgi:hypothetical protein